MNGYNGCENVCESEETAWADSTCGTRGSQAGATRVWLVDDNDNFRVLLAGLLNDEPGIEVARDFCSPDGALTALAVERAPDIILLDIQMGPDNGLDAIRPIKALAPDTHVLMLTTVGEPESRERAFREGASDFMLKSWELSKIVRHMREAMELGSAAGLVTAFFNQPRPTGPIRSAAEGAKLDGQTSLIERGITCLRDLFKLGNTTTRA